jgi:hypothetical protein
MVEHSYKIKKKNTRDTEAIRDLLSKKMTIMMFINDEKAYKTFKSLIFCPQIHTATTHDQC